MKIRYVVIEREYGSGGTEIGRRTAEACHMACYGREIMELAAQRENTSVEALEQYEENVSGSLLYSMLVMTQSQTGNPDLASRESKLYVTEKQIIRELSRSGPAVFVGHCAGKALEEEPGVLRVFIHGREADKHKRIVTDYGIAPRDVAAVCRRFNRRRANFYHFCTGKKWDDATQYDLILDSSTLGVAGCVRVLQALIQPEE